MVAVVSLYRRRGDSVTKPQPFGWGLFMGEYKYVFSIDFFYHRPKEQYKYLPKSRYSF